MAPHLRHPTTFTSPLTSPLPDATRPRPDANVVRLPSGMYVTLATALAMGYTVRRKDGTVVEPQTPTIGAGRAATPAPIVQRDPKELTRQAARARLTKAVQKRQRKAARRLQGHRGDAPRQGPP